MHLYLKRGFCVLFKTVTGLLYRGRSNKLGPSIWYLEPFIIYIFLAAGFIIFIFSVFSMYWMNRYLFPAPSRAEYGTGV